MDDVLFCVNVIVSKLDCLSQVVVVEAMSLCSLTLHLDNQKHVSLYSLISDMVALGVLWKNLLTNFIELVMVVANVELFLLV